MKQVIILIAVIGLIPITLNSESTDCECGTHSTGITAYNVEGDDCCLDAPSTYGTVYTYEEQGNGTWEVTSSTVVTGDVAQSNCCKPNT